MRCPNCGAKLEITDEMDQFTCSYCGTELFAVRQGGTVALKPLVAAIEKLQAGADKTAAELAIPRLRDELEKLQKNRQKWEVNTQARVAVTQAKIDKLRANRVAFADNFLLIGGAAIATMAAFLFCAMPGLLTFARLETLRPYIVWIVFWLAVCGVVVYVIVSVRIRAHLRQSKTPQILSLQKEIDDSNHALADALTKYDHRIREVSRKIDEKQKIADS